MHRFLIKKKKCASTPLNYISKAMTFIFFSRVDVGALFRMKKFQNYVPQITFRKKIVVNLYLSISCIKRSARSFFLANCTDCNMPKHLNALLCTLLVLVSVHSYNVFYPKKNSFTNSNVRIYNNTENPLSVHCF